MNKLMDKPDLCMTGAGLITSVGHDLKTACASIRAGLKRPRKLDNFYVQSETGHDDWEDGLVTGHPVIEGGYNNTEQRLFSLLTSALRDLCDQTETDRSLVGAAPLFLALPEGYRAKTDRDRLESFAADGPGHFLSGTSDIVTVSDGHAGVVTAICHAAEAIGAGQCERAVVAGVDSLIGFDDLSLFNRQGRLKTVFNSDGFIPGEAASAVLIESRSAAEKRNAAIGAVIGNISTGCEKDHVLSGNPATGAGLAGVISRMVQEREGRGLAAAAVISDLNGELYRFEEWALVQLKAMGGVAGEKEMIYPVRNLGDTGAASAGVAICIAVRAMAGGYVGRDNSDRNILILASSDSGARGALYLEPSYIKA